MKRKARDPDDVPEQGPEFFARAQRVPDGPGMLEAAIRVAAEKVLAERRRRGKQKAPTKQLVSLRLSQDVLSTYKGTGRGWQSRIASDLEKAAKRLKASSPSER